MLQQMTPAAIAVLGSCNMDVVAFADRAPTLGETVAGRRFATIPGGKGANQAIAAARAGGAVRMIGAVGDDDFGRALRTVLGEAQVDAGAVRASAEPTGIAHIVVDARGGNSIVVIPGANGTVTSLTAADEAIVANSAVLLLQLELPMEAAIAGAAVARRAGTRVILTPAPVQDLPPELLANVDLLAPNEHEIAQITGIDEPREALRAMLEQVPEVVVTLGAEGCVYGARTQGGTLHVPAPKVEAVDTTAAGDTFVGVLAVALAEGRNMQEALRWASAAAALSVQRAGASTSMPKREAIDAFAALHVAPG
ncbi:ribokinase [Pendulispora albinea]|uniref:Ribokinase n=1 Tax=Pendulispora albinea TaxID=2741071 RepID=A0ABZ2LRR8_9BACT